ncbi:uncharacterized protein PRCAT00000524001 [Priceomyces carsonii]|uniref:uncharacterized protein n=1 Tax=Priceomyces carsonii TaxID=28549 RepID=UPI002EDA8C09|nr:unnamed protein product [Priceomyces carsonii]
MTDLKTYIITLKDSVSDADVKGLKEKIKSLGGSITSEFSLIKGFTAKLPSIHSEAIGNHNDVATIEEDKEVKIQS